jgi:cell division transport system ATP-binding protein
MRLIYLAMQPTKGDLSIFGYNTHNLRPEDQPIMRRRIGIVLQDFGLIDHLSVFENVALPLRIRGLDVNQYTQDIIELLEWVGLGNRVHAEPAVLSGGEQQRVCIARAVIARPDLILADEPTGNVDPEMAERLMRLFVELNKLGATVLIATHDYGLIDNFRTDILKLLDGKLWGMPYRTTDTPPVFTSEIDAISVGQIDVQDIEYHEHLIR